MNLGGLKLLVLSLSITVGFTFSESQGQQPGPQQARQQQAQGQSRAQGSGQNVRQLNQGQTDRLAQLGGQAPSQPVRPNFQLSAEEQKYLEQALDYWQQQSEGIKLYQCTFERHVYDTGLTNYRNPKTRQLSADSVAVGEIRYANPGKASYETTGLFKFDGPGKDYKPVSDNKLREKWVTDGDAVYEFDFQQKRLYETRLPVDMRGEGAISNSPIPFMFGAKKDQILQRYWVRVITPPGAKDEVWLEAWPKRAEDAQNYKKVEIILSMEPFLPKAVHMYMPQYDPKKNNYSSIYISFADQSVNNRLAKLTNFLGNFVRPGLPTFEAGWKRVDRQQMNATAAGASPRQQQR